MDRGHSAFLLRHRKTAGSRMVRGTQFAGRRPHGGPRVVRGAEPAVKPHVIVAGGQGTRLPSEIGPLPKALADIDGRPLLFTHLDLAAAHGFREVVLLVCYGAQSMRDACGDGD